MIRVPRPGKPQAISYFRASLLGLAVAFYGFSIAQEIELQSSAEEASNVLQVLDEKAAACLSAVDNGGDSQVSCDDFLSAIDGELMANYLQHCTTLKSWRDDFVARVSSSTDDIENSEEMLELLIAVEYSCGQNALQARTQNVLAAFALLQDERPTQIDAELRRRLSEMKFEATENRGRQSLLNSVRQQQSTPQRETQRQSTTLENELIRQQIRNSNQLN